MSHTHRAIFTTVGEMSYADKIIASTTFSRHPADIRIHHHHHHVACPMVDVAVPTSLLHACRF